MFDPLGSRPDNEADQGYFNERLPISMTDTQAERCLREFLEALVRGDAATAEAVCKSGTTSAGEVVFPGRVGSYQMGKAWRTRDGHGLVYEVEIRDASDSWIRYQATVEPRLVVAPACYVTQFRQTA